LRGALLKRPQTDCRCELCVSGITDPARMALRAAQIELGHDMLCGTQFRACAECDAAMARHLARPIADLKAEPFGCVSGPDMEPDDLTKEYSDIYFGMIEPARCGSLLSAPVWVADVAKIGDEVMGEVQAEMMREAKRGGGGPGLGAGAASDPGLGAQPKKRAAR